MSCPMRRRACLVIIFKKLFFIIKNKKNEKNVDNIVVFFCYEYKILSLKNSNVFYVLKNYNPNKALILKPKNVIYRETKC